MQGGLLTGGRGLEDEISPELYARVEGSLAALGLPVTRFLEMKPWVLANVLTLLKMMSLGYDAESGVDRYFLDRSGDREIVPLETPAEQIATFEQLDGEEFLAYTLISLEVMDAQAPRMIQAWRCGHGAALASILFGLDLLPQSGPGSNRELLFTARNRRMADRLEPLLERGGQVFVVVGAGHLLGEDGIPALLEKRGYAVERRYQDSLRP